MRGSYRSMKGRDSGGGAVTVFAPSPLLEVVLEGTDAEPEVHLHAGGQGFWIARMASVLGADVTLCSTFGGETGAVLRALIEQSELHLRSVATRGWNGCVVRDARSDLVDVADGAPTPLSRHELDDLYGLTLVEGMETTVSVLGGPDRFPQLLDADVYRRLAKDLRASDRIVVADLSGDPLEAALDAGVSVLKVSSDKLEDTGLVHSQKTDELLGAIERLSQAGAEQVIVTRAQKGVLALVNGRLVEAKSPSLQVVDPNGAGDSLTGGVAAGLAKGDDLESALRLGMAAGSLNATRHGLASGTREEIERLMTHIGVHEVQ